MNILQHIGSIVLSAALALSGFLGYHAPAPTVEPAPLGAALPGTTAVFETSLASPITSSATSMTLAANAVRGGGTISGFNCFTVDEGSAQAETICGTVSGTAVSSLTRGISQSTGTTTVSALQFSHRRGANVKITDFPVIQILKAQNNGEDTFPNILNYTTHPTFVGTTNVVDKKYVDDIAFSGAAVIDATTLARGVGELATQAETALGTVTGGSGVLLIPNGSATSTYNSATAANRVLVTDGTGKLDGNFLPTIIPNVHTYSATSTMATTTVNGITLASTTQTTFNASGTWTKPTSGTMALIQVWGGGGGGSTGGGGGGGAYNQRVIRLSDLGATETVTIPAAAATNAAAADVTFGTWLTGYGGGGASGNSGGGGGGILSVGGSSSGAGAPGGSPGGAAIGASNSGFGGAGGAATANPGGASAWGGGGGGGSANPGGASYYGGGGGAGSGSTGGASVLGGAGGAASVAGTAPGGGGGSNAVGGLGRVVVTVF